MRSKESVAAFGGLWTAAAAAAHFAALGYGPQPQKLKVAKATSIGWGDGEYGSVLGGIPQQTRFGDFFEVDVADVVLYGRARTGHAYVAGLNPTSPIFRGSFVLVHAG